jgi:hypothetical protein
MPNDKGLTPGAIAVYLQAQRERNLTALEKEWRRFEAAGKR